MKKKPRLRRNKKSRKNFRRINLERLEDRRVLTAMPAFAPGTPQDVVDDWAAEHGHESNLPEGAEAFRFVQGGRWGSTTTNAGPLVDGDATVLTWSIVQDGVQLPNGGGNAPAQAPSDLRAMLVGIYGGTTADPAEQQPWFEPFQKYVDRWAELSGLTFVYEPNDDGTPMGNAPGQLGVVADMRIGGRNVDGANNILAFNFIPSAGGDMVIDTADVANYSDVSNDSRFLRNVLGHEAGHGIGLAHTIPTDGTKLMEPDLSTTTSWGLNVYMATHTNQMMTPAQRWIWVSCQQTGSRLDKRTSSSICRTTSSPASTTPPMLTTSDLKFRPAPLPSG